MFIMTTLLPAILTGGLMIYSSSHIAKFFETTGSVNLIRGLDNPWTFKTLGFVIAVGYPLYVLATDAILSGIST